MNNLTYIEKFNSYLGQFLKDLITTFPEIKNNVEKKYNNLLTQNENIIKTDEYVKEYMNNIKQYTKDISNKNDKIFKTGKEIYLIEYINITNLWLKDLNDKTRDTIWNYLQILYVIGKKIIGDEDIDELLKNLNNKDIGEIKKDTDDMLNMIKNLSTVEQDPDNNVEEEANDKNTDDMKEIFDNGIISDIAKELTNELNLEEMDVGNPNNLNEAFQNMMNNKNGNTNFFDLVSKVGEKIQNKVKNGEVNQGDLLNEAQKMMGGLKDPKKMANILRNQKNSSNPTRDRLRKKLEKRNLNKDTK